MHNEKLHNINASLDIISVIRSRRIVWAVHVARMGEKCIQNSSRKILRGRSQLGDLSVDGRIRNYITQTGCKDVDLSDRGQHMIQWRALVGTVQHRRFHRGRGIL